MPNPASQGSVGVPNEYSAYYAKVNFTTGTSAHTTEFYATQGTQGSDARMRTVALMDDDDVWVGGGMSPGSQSNTFFGQHVSDTLRVPSSFDLAVMLMETVPPTDWIIAPMTIIQRRPITTRTVLVMNATQTMMTMASRTLRT